MFSIRFIIFSTLLSWSLFSKAASINVVTEVFPDFQYLNEQGELVGSAAEIVKQVLEKSGVDYEISVVNWAIAYNAALRRQDTCLFSVARLASREDQFLWGFPVGKFTTSFYGLKSAKIKINQLGDALNYKTAVIRNNFSHLYLLENGFNEDQHLILISSFDNVFDLIATRKKSLDLVILSDAQYRYRLEMGGIHEPLERLFTLQQENTELYFVCSKSTDRRTFDKIQKTFKQLYSHK